MIYFVYIFAVALIGGAVFYALASIILFLTKRKSQKQDLIDMHRLATLNCPVCGSNFGVRTASESPAKKMAVRKSSNVRASVTDEVNWRNGWFVSCRNCSSSFFWDRDSFVLEEEKLGGKDKKL